MTKRIMRTFKINEISAVDFPAQKGARATILKRDDSDDPYWKRDFSSKERDQLASTGAALPDGSFPIKSVQDLKNAIHAIGRAKDPAKAKAHIIARAKSLGATSELPDGWVSKRHERTDDMTEAEIQKMIADAVTAATADLSKKLEDANTAIKKMGADNKKKPQADSYDDGDEPDADDAQKSAWRPYIEKRVASALAKAKAEFDAEVAKADDIRKNDESFTGEGGVVIRKSDYAKAEHFTMAKAQQDRIEMQDFTKKAEAEIPHLPGTSLVKAVALRAIAKLEKGARDAIEAMLKGGNAAMKASMSELGNNGGMSEGSASADLEKLATTYAAENKVEKSAAYDAVLKTVEGKALYAKSLTEKRAA